MTKVVGYTRVSKEEQVQDGYSLTCQRDEIMRYCTDSGIELMHIYENKGISGAKKGVGCECKPIYQGGKLIGYSTKLRAYRVGWVNGRPIFNKMFTMRD